MLGRQSIAFKHLRSLLYVAILVVTTGGCHTYTESYDNAKVRAQEDGLQSALKYIREAIKDYTKDHGKPPHQLDDLVTSGYFNSIPVDPMTNKADWSIEFEPCKGAGPCEKFIKDVHSSSTAKSSKNTLYSEW